MELYQFLEANLQALEEKKSPVVPWLRGQDFDLISLENQLVVNRFGLVDLPLNENLSMFANVPPQAYYSRWTAPEPATKSATVIVGCNLGYGLNHLLTTLPPLHPVAVLEPRPELLAACLAMTDYTGFIKQGRLTFIPPHPEALHQALCAFDLQFIYGAVKFRSDIPSRQLGPEYARWSETAQKTMENIAMELTTLRRMQDTMVGNEIGNFRQAFANGSVTGLADSAKGLTGVILGAGPSLAEFGPQIAANPGGALYATALQTLPAVHAQGIKPHMCMVIDYSPGVKNVFKRLDMEWAKDIPLIYSTKVRPDVIEMYPGPTIPMWTIGGLATYIMRDLEYVMDAGGNVSVALMRFFERCGISRMLLVGQDFAWKGEHSHVKGHHAQPTKRAFDPVRHVKLKNMHGEEIISAMSYVTAQRDMQVDCKRMDIPVYNLYGGGLEIEGSTVVTLDDITRGDLLASKDGALERFGLAMGRAQSPRTRPTFEPRLGAWTSSLKSAQKRLHKMFKKSAKKQGEIRGMLGHVLMFLKQDPLYTPYIYNEFMDIAAMSKLGGTHGMKEFTKIKNIFARVLEKVKEIDEAMSKQAGEKAA
ncbi:motility associated factor glycosyltransferase family protein [Desulfovibrio ferrophilus]|uniref:6-hydroxymethylpterin diphosphokinase MptE-like domain-containing protein n=1 Tax=Desulfovibrio ferrophilus TaxID=241368 RepID=A0A2Z6AUL1_9BACT|nr:6-hydroxymethylpterin diphosphokinase MptE-like protein [Desulfovibrio ferrophilus]BBD06927.1 uncharacterized protein DFE_0201 [Desulfovibrio ferrophilus]